MLILLLSAIFLPIITGIAILLFSKVAVQRRNLLVLLSGGLSLLSVVLIYPIFRTTGPVAYSFTHRLPLGLYLDELSYILAIMIAFLWFLVTVCSIDYLSNPGPGELYYPFLSLSLGAAMGIFFAGDLFTMFLFYQLLIVATYLIIVNKTSEGVLKHGLQYLSLAAASGIILLIAVGLVFYINGSVSTTSASVPLYSASISLVWSITLFSLFMLSFGTMATAYPYYVWQQDAHPLAPSPLAALLAALMLKTAAYGALRVVENIFGASFIRYSPASIILTVVSFCLLITGFYLTIKQRTIKGRLAHSALVQQGYIMLNLALMTETFFQSSFYHLFFYVFIIAVIFLCSGIMIWRTGKNDIKELALSARQLPITTITYTNAALMASAIPLYKVFLLLAEGGSSVKELYIYLPGLLAVSLFNAFIYLPITVGAWFSVKNNNSSAKRNGQIILLPVTSKDNSGKHRYMYTLEAPAPMLISMIILNLACILLALMSLYTG